MYKELPSVIPNKLNFQMEKLDLYHRITSDNPASPNEQIKITKCWHTCAKQPYQNTSFHPHPLTCNFQATLLKNKQMSQLERHFKD